MRHLKIITVGKLKQSARYLQTGIELYTQRLKPVMAFQWIELPESGDVSKEAQAIERHLEAGLPTVLLNERGRLLDSQSLSQWLFGPSPYPKIKNGDSENPQFRGTQLLEWHRMIWIVGGANGTDPRLDDLVTATVSLSPLTFPHQLVRLLLVEQLYRAHCLHQNVPYHKA